MSIKRLTGVWQHSQLKGTGLLCLLAIADRARDDGFAWPGLHDIAGRARTHRRNARRLIRRAEALGELYIHERSGSTHQYLVLAGQDEDEIYTALEARFGLDEDEIAAWLHSRQGTAGRRDEMSGEAAESYPQDGGVPGGRGAAGRGAGAAQPPESLMNPKKNNPDENTKVVAPPPEHERVWQQCLWYLEQDAGSPKKMDEWFGGTRPLHLDAERLVIEAPTAYRRDWLQARMARTAQNYLVGIVGDRLAVEFVLAEEAEAANQEVGTAN